MKIRELSDRSSVPLPTIKFYIREGLLPAGRRTAKNQAEYGEEHLARLALVRALKEDAGFGISAIARSLRASDAARVAKAGFVSAAIDAIERPSGAEVDEGSLEFLRAKGEVTETAKRMNWRIDETSTALRDAARALAILHRSYPEVAARPYAEAAASIAKYEIPDAWRPLAAPDKWLQYAVLGTVLAEPLLLALRRMAHIARSLEVECRTTGNAASAPSTPAKTQKKKTSRESPAKRALRTSRRC